MSFVAASLMLLQSLQQPVAADLHERLAKAVDLPKAEERQKAAVELARTGTLEQWLETCRSFGTFAPMEPGVTRQDVELRVLDTVETTEVFLYVPEGYDASKAAPLLLWGHGAGGTGETASMVWKAVADRVGMFVLAITESGKEGGWAFAPRQRAAELAALRWARRKVNVDENAIFVGGRSRGGHMTWDLMLRHPDLFAGALPCIGGPRLQVGATNNMRYLENVVHLPIRDLQGSQDDPLLLVNLRLAFARLQKLGAKDAVLREFETMGHDCDLGAVDWIDFFARRRVPVPRNVVRVAADENEARSAWVDITAFEAKVTVDGTPLVDARVWDRLDEAGRRALLLDKFAEITARLVVRTAGRGRFSADGQLVKSFELWLTAEQIAKDGVEVLWRGRATRRAVTPAAEPLLRCFVERFDRTFLPVARVTVP